MAIALEFCVISERFLFAVAVHSLKCHGDRPVIKEK